jgi:hypothetical protein
MRRTRTALGAPAAVMAAAAAMVSPASAQTLTGGTAPAAATVGDGPAQPPPERVRTAYRRWRSRLERHDLYIGRNLIAEVRAADGTEPAPTTADLRHSIHRMQRRWTRWLRTSERGEKVMFKLKVRQSVPDWAKQYLHGIAWCESRGDPNAVGGGGAYRGMYQFSISTWYVVGGEGDPAAASRWEQTWRAWLLLSRHGSGHWPNCG